MAVEASVAKRAKRVLFVFVGRVGDMVMATPALRIVLRKHPEAEIHLLTSAAGRRVLAGFDPRITECHVYRRKGLAHSLRRLRLRRRLTAEPYDVAYCLDHRETYRRLVDGAARELVQIAGDVSQDEPLPLHFLRLVDDGRDPGQDEWVALPVCNRSRAKVAERLERDGIDASRLVVGLHPSFYGVKNASVRRTHHARRKMWPVSQWAELARRLSEWARDQGQPLAVIADLLPEDRSLGEDLRNASGGAVRVYTEPPDFERYKATIERMNLLITPDTGPMHVAAAVGTRIVALFSSHTPMLYAPYTHPDRVTILKAGEPTGEERGLEHIEPRRVLEAAVDQLGRGLADASS